MIGFALALCTALSEAGKDVFFSSKTIRPLPHLQKAFTLSLGMIPILGCVVGVVGMAELKPGFWMFVSIHAALMAVAIVCYMYALALGPLSQTQPILALTTVLLVITTPLMTNDVVTPLGWAGVVMVGIGIYGTQHPGRDPESGRLPPFTAPLVEMFRQAGVRYKLAVALIFSTTANLDRLCLERSDGPTYLLVDQVLVCTFLAVAIVALQRNKGTPRAARLGVSHVKTLAPGICANAASLLLHMWALTFLSVPYVIATKRLSILFTSLWGYGFRKERSFHWYRLIGLILVVSGVAVILIYGRASAS